MMLAETSRTCCICKKLFCCAQCREKHEKSKHSDRELNCPFCKSQKLPLQSLEDESLLCHIIISHLPLHCCLCGEVFKQGTEFESLVRGNKSACKWWNSRNRHSLVSDSKFAVGTPLLTLGGKESPLNNEYNGKFGSLTSPPALYRSTSTPMVVNQKNSLDFKTPNVPDFSLKTPKTSSVSLKKEKTCSGFQESSESNYVSFPSSTNHEDTPFRSLSLNCLSKDNLPKVSSKKLDVMKEQEITNIEEQGEDNSSVDMDLTGVVGEIVPDSQSLETGVQRVRRSDSLKKVRFSDQYETPEPSTTVTMNATENDEYFEACDTLSEMKENLENSQIKIYEENVKNIESEKNSPEKATVTVSQQSSGSSRVLMMMVVENNSSLPTSNLIDSGLKKLEHLASGVDLTASNRISSGCSSSVSTVNNYYNFPAYDSYSPPNQIVSSARRDSNSSSNSSGSSSSGGIFAAVANAMRSVMRNFSGVGTFRNIEREQVSPREDIIPRPSTSETFNPMSRFASSLLTRPGKRSRETLENVSSPQRQLDVVVPQIEPRSPLAKRPRGWYKIKAREPLARMRNIQLRSPRGVSSETQVFRQGSLSVGDTVLPLPSRAHQSTQTD